MSRGRGRALWLPDVLRTAGLPVEVVAGWEHRGNEPREWVTQVDHHTASNPRGGARPSLGIVTHGRPDVPGPLCNVLLDRNSIPVVVAAGAANHPGVSWIPQRGGIGSGVKYWALGTEVELSGVGEPFPPGGRQYETMIRIDAAICTYLGLDPIDVTDHKKIARPHGRKIDISPYDLDAGRVRVARQIADSSGGLTVAQYRALNQKLDRLLASNTRIERELGTRLRRVDDAIGTPGRGVRQALALMDQRSVETVQAVRPEGPIRQGIGRIEDRLRD